MKDNRYNLGLVSISFRKHSPSEILEAVKAAGLSCIEWGSDVHAPCHDTERLNDIAQMQKEYGIECSSYGTYFRFGETPVEELVHYIAAAKLLGTNILRLWCGTKNGSALSDEEKQTLMEQCRKAARLAEQHGVTLCMECHKGTYTEKLEDALSLMREIHSPHFAMYWQPFQWKTPEENIAYAKAIAPYTHHLHVFQWKGKQRFSLGEGREEWQDYLSQLQPPRTLLLEFMPDNQLATLPAEAAALRRIVSSALKGTDIV